MTPFRCDLLVLLLCQLTKTQLLCQFTKTQLPCQFTKTQLLWQLTKTQLLCQFTKTQLLCQFTKTQLLCQFTKTQPAGYLFLFHNIFLGTGQSCFQLVSLFRIMLLRHTDISPFRIVSAFCVSVHDLNQLNTKSVTKEWLPLQRNASFPLINN